MVIFLQVGRAFDCPCTTPNIAFGTVLEHGEVAGCRTRAGTIGMDADEVPTRQADVPERCCRNAR